jgi:hypothetical protein
MLRDACRVNSSAYLLAVEVVVVPALLQVRGLSERWTARMISAIRGIWPLEATSAFASTSRRSRALVSAYPRAGLVKTARSFCTAP